MRFKVPQSYKKYGFWTNKTHILYALGCVEQEKSPMSGGSPGIVMGVVPLVRRFVCDVPMKAGVS